MKFKYFYEFKEPHALLSIDIYLYILISQFNSIRFYSLSHIAENSYVSDKISMIKINK